MPHSAAAGQYVDIPTGGIRPRRPGKRFMRTVSRDVPAHAFTAESRRTLCDIPLVDLWVLDGDFESLSKFRRCPTCTDLAGIEDPP